MSLKLIKNLFNRKLLLAKFYFKEPEKTSSYKNEESSEVINKGNYHKPTGRYITLDNYVNCLQKYPLGENIKNKKKQFEPKGKASPGSVKTRGFNYYQRG